MSVFYKQECFFLELLGDVLLSLLEISGSRAGAGERGGGRAREHMVGLGLSQAVEPWTLPLFPPPPHSDYTSTSS